MKLPKGNWKAVVGNRRYMVSDDGRVFTLGYNKPGRVLKPTVNINGYHTVCIYYDDKKRHERVHRILAQAWIGDISGKQINHINGIKTDNRLCNLEITNNSGNQLHRRRVLGQESLRKIKSSDLPRIIKMFADGKTCAEISVRYGVGPTAISSLLRYRFDNRDTAVSIKYKKQLLLGFARLKQGERMRIARAALDSLGKGEDWDD